MPTLNQALPPGWYLQVQLPIVTDDSEPEPDFSVIRGKPRDYKGRKPGSADTGLAIEVADSSLDQERDLKGPIYAGARIPIYWIINLKEEKVEVYTDPAGSDESAAYASRADYGMNESVPLVLDGREVARIPVPELLP